jgi:hypothetical protein
MRHWTLEERQRQSELIKKWKPWQSAGVKTSEGKSISRMNAYKHGARSAEIRTLAREMTEWKKQLNQIIKINKESI